MSSSSSTCWCSQLCVDSNGVHGMTNANLGFPRSCLSTGRRRAAGGNELQWHESRRQKTYQPSEEEQEARKRAGERLSAKKVPCIVAMSK